MDFDFNQWIGPLALLVAAVQLYHQMRQTKLMEAQTGNGIAIGHSIWPKVSKFWKTPGIFALSLLVILAWTPRVIDRFFPQDNFKLIKYGIEAPFVFHAEMLTQSIARYKDNYRMMLVVRMQYGNIDRMRDHSIEKSITYTIEGAHISMYAPGQVNPLKLRIQFDHPIVNIEYDGVLIPSSVSPDDITSLSDVEKFGGKILDVGVQQIPTADIGVRPANAPPLVPCTSSPDK